MNKQASTHDEIKIIKKGINLDNVLLELNLNIGSEIFQLLVASKRTDI